MRSPRYADAVVLVAGLGIWWHSGGAAVEAVFAAIFAYLMIAASTAAFPGGSSVAVGAVVGIPAVASCVLRSPLLVVGLCPRLSLKKSIAGF